MSEHPKFVDHVDVPDFEVYIRELYKWGAENFRGDLMEAPNSRRHWALEAGEELGDAGCYAQIGYNISEGPQQRSEIIYIRNGIIELGNYVKGYVSRHVDVGKYK